MAGSQRAGRKTRPIFATDGALPPPSGRRGITAVMLSFMSVNVMECGVSDSPGTRREPDKGNSFMVRRDRPGSKTRYTIRSLLMPWRSRPVSVITGAGRCPGSFSVLSEAPEAETTEETPVITVAHEEHPGDDPGSRRNVRRGGTMMGRQNSVLEGTTVTAPQARRRQGLAAVVRVAPCREYNGNLTVG